ncbi:MAG: DUF362 domain-containing protein [Deltaproteobacteria bacterium]|nr:DUF362 domain-containing protein [Deltaproteobacteria bacterium]
MDNKNPLVVISKGEDPYETTKTTLQKFPLPDLKGRKVLIKPNAARLASPGEGVTTHPSVVEATIDRLKEKGVADIVIGESCIFGVKPREAFRMTGMKGISEKKKVKLVDLDQIDPMEMMIPEGKVIKKIKVSSILKEVDFIISIPVIKTHMHTQVTLSIKNMKGLLWRREKARLHQPRCNESVTQGYKTLDIAISDMASVLFPHLAIIDGTVGMEGMGPAYGRPKKMGIVLVGNNSLSTDAVATRLMGFDPKKVPHFKLSAKKGLGEIQLKQISIQPEDYLKWEAPFNPPPSKLSIPFPDIIVHNEGSCSACLSTLLVFLQNYHSLLSNYRLKDKKIHIGIGRHLNTFPEGAILLGNCTSKMKSKGVFIQGCPPVASQIWDTFLKKKRVMKNFS